MKTSTRQCNTPPPPEPHKLRRLLLATALAMLLATLLAGCGSRSGLGDTAAAAQGSADSALLLDLPALLVDYDANGKPHIGSVALDQLAQVLPSTLLSQLTLDATTIQRLNAANIQHIQLSNTPAGLRILVNNQPLPTVAWDKQSLANLLDLLRQANIGAVDRLAGLLPLVTDLGVGVTLRFPVPGDASPILLSPQGREAAAAVAQQAQQGFLQAAGSQPTLRIPVYYNADGTWTVGNISDTRWQALTGLPFGYVRLNPELIANAVKAGISEVTLRTDRDGIHLALGSAGALRELPYLRWADGGLATALKLAQQFGLVQVGDDAQMEALLAQWLPALQSTDLTIQVHFPQE